MMGLRHRAKEARLEDILDQHANTLIEGGDSTEALVQEYGEVFPALDSLLRLAQRVHGILMPVEPSQEFVTDLRTKLITRQQGDQAVAVAWTVRRKRWERISRVLVPIVSIIAVLALAVRIAGSLILIVTFIIGRRRRAAPA